MTMKSTDFLMIVAIVAVALAAVNLITTINKIGDFKTLSGFATSTGVANLTVQSNVNINFTTNSVDWGTGYVTIGSNPCELTTEGGTTNCTNFNSVTQPLVLENIGNEDVNLTFSSSKNAASFIGTGATFEWKVTELNNSCFAGDALTSYTTATTTNATACDNFTYAEDNDTLELDLRVTIPNSGISTDAKTTTITATAFSIA